MKKKEIDPEIKMPICIDIVLSKYQYNEKNNTWNFTNPFSRGICGRFSQNITVYLMEEYMVEIYINELKFFEILDVPSHPEIWEKIEKRYKRRMEEKQIK